MKKFLKPLLIGQLAEDEPVKNSDIRKDFTQLRLTAEKMVEYLCCSTCFVDQCVSLDADFVPVLFLAFNGSNNKILCCRVYLMAACFSLL